MKILKRENVFSGFFNVEKILIRESESVQYERIFVKKNPGCGILLFNKTTFSVILVKQYRAPLIDKEQNMVVEIPAGIVSEGEAPSKCIIREVEEETGYLLDTVEEVYSFYTSPGFTDEKIFLFYGEVHSSDKISQGGGLISENESIEILEIPVPELIDLLNRKEIADAKSLIAIEWFLRNKIG